MASVSARSVCAAAGSMRASSIGKNSSCRSGAAGLKARRTRAPSIVADAASSVVGCGTWARVLANSGARGDGAASARTGKVNCRSAPPGMHTSLQISQSARAFNCTV